jgi:hypothetical protein
MQRIQIRPLSPDVLEIDGKSAHYKFPWGALSSIANRVTGVALSVGECMHYKEAVTCNIFPTFFLKNPLKISLLGKKSAVTRKMLSDDE